MKITYLHRLFFIMLLAGYYGFSQDSNTVFVTVDNKDEKKEKSSFFERGGFFSNFSLSVPLRANTEHGTNDPDTGKRSDYWFLPDGINFHGGFGVHISETIGVSLNSGIDGIVTPKLGAVPVYGSLVVSPKINDDTGILLQYGIGRAFALGRGDLSGIYQKYRLGLTNTDKMALYIEANYYGFGLHDIKQISTFNVGICLFNFE